VIFIADVVCVDLSNPWLTPLFGREESRRTQEDPISSPPLCEHCGVPKLKSAVDKVHTVLRTGMCKWGCVYAMCMCMYAHVYVFLADQFLKG
jgi:hypothetical protein